MDEKTTNKIDVTGFMLRNKTLLILLVLCVFAAVASSDFLQVKNILNVVRQVTVSGIIGVAFTMVLASGCIDLSVGYMVGMIGVIAASLSRDGVPIIMVILGAVLVGCFCGAINGAIVTYLRLPGFVVTLATGQIFKGTDYIVCNTTTITGLDESFRVIGQGYLLGVPVPIYIMIGMAVLMAIILNKTAMGRHIIAMGGNEEAARLSGINANATKMFVYIMLGACAAVGALVQTGRTFCAQPDAGFGMEMDIIAAVVIGGTPLTGGIGKVAGTIFGCLIVGVINNILNLLGVSSNWQLIAKGILILFAIALDTISSLIIAKREARQ